MSAVAGLYWRDGRPAERADVERMAAALATRGPDGSDSWQQGAVGLAHCALWTTPEARRERQPLACQDGHLVVTADARLDNRDDLIATLALGGREPEEIGDAELILASYERWGEECVGKLLGDFAFAIWDARRQHLVCARDHIGVRSLYYHCSERLFAFATEIKALLCLEQVPRRLNETQVADFLLPLFDDRAGTFYRGIVRLPAAHVLVVSASGSRLRRYWAPDARRELRLRSDAAYAEAFAEVFRQAVDCRLRSTTAIASTLSGGLDSSSIACLARDRLAARGRPPLHTFSAIFPSLSAADLRAIDERPYMEAVVVQGGIAPHFVRADRLSPFLDLTTLLARADEPYVAPNIYMHWALFQAAHAERARVFLDGIDGDTTVSHGLGYLPELLIRGRWWRLWREVKALTTTANPYYTLRRLIWEFGVKPLVPEDAIDVWRSWRGRPQPVWGADAVVNPAFARRIGLGERVRTLTEVARTPALRERETHRRALVSGLIPYALELADKAAATFALEVRYPFFDRRLMEFCLALPGEQKLHAGWTRSVMRRALTGILPAAVQWRTQKANLGPNFTRRLIECEQETLERVVLGDARVIEAYVDVPALRAAYRRYAAPSSRNPTDAATVYRIVILALWLERAGLQP